MSISRHVYGTIWEMIFGAGKRLWLYVDRYFWTKLYIWNDAVEIRYQITVSHETACLFYSFGHNFHHSAAGHSHLCLAHTVQIEDFLPEYSLSVDLQVYFACCCVFRSARNNKYYFNTIQDFCNFRVLENLITCLDI